MPILDKNEERSNVAKISKCRIYHFLDFFPDFLAKFEAHQSSKWAYHWMANSISYRFLANILLKNKAEQRFRPLPGHLGSWLLACNIILTPTVLQISIKIIKYMVHFLQVYSFWIGLTEQIIINAMPVWLIYQIHCAKYNNFWIKQIHRKKFFY